MPGRVDTCTREHWTHSRYVIQFGMLSQWRSWRCAYVKPWSVTAAVWGLYDELLLLCLQLTVIIHAADWLIKNSDCNARTLRILSKGIVLVWFRPFIENTGNGYRVLLHTILLFRQLNFHFVMHDVVIWAYRFSCKQVTSLEHFMTVMTLFVCVAAAKWNSLPDSLKDTALSLSCF